MNPRVSIGGDTLRVRVSNAYGDGKLVVVASSQAKGKKYYIYAHDAATGEPVWNTELKWRGEGHGAHLDRPAIVGNRLFVRPATYDLSTGAKHEVEMRHGGCGTYAASSDAIFC